MVTLHYNYTGRNLGHTIQNNNGKCWKHTPTG